MRKKTLSMILALCMLLTSSMTVAMAGTTNDIDYGMTMKKNMSFYHYGKTTSKDMKGFSNTQWVKTTKIPSSAKGVKVASSNKNVASVQKVIRDGGITRVQIKLRKAGKAKIILTGTVDKKKIKYSTNIKVLKYKNPVVSFTLGSKNYSSKFKRTAGIYTISKKSGKYKFFCKAAAGWRIRDITLVRSNASDDTDIGNYKKIKNNSVISLKKKKEAEITVTLYNKKANKVENLCITVKCK